MKVLLNQSHNPSSTQYEELYRMRNLLLPGVYDANQGRSEVEVWAETDDESLWVSVDGDYHLLMTQEEIAGRDYDQVRARLRSAFGPFS